MAVIMETHGPDRSVAYGVVHIGAGADNPDDPIEQKR